MCVCVYSGIPTPSLPPLPPSSLLQRGCCREGRNARALTQVGICCAAQHHLALFQLPLPSPRLRPPVPPPATQGLFTNSCLPSFSPALPMPEEDFPDRQAWADGSSSLCGILQMGFNYLFVARARRDVCGAIHVHFFFSLFSSRRLRRPTFNLIS